MDVTASAKIKTKDREKETSKIGHQGCEHATANVFLSICKNKTLVYKNMFKERLGQTRTQTFSPNLIARGRISQTGMLKNVTSKRGKV